MKTNRSVRQWTDAEVRELRTIYFAGGESVRSLAVRTGASPSSIANMLNGTTYREVEGWQWAKPKPRKEKPWPRKRR